eukprot:c20128_g1_i1 orf=222-2069(-)
MGKFFNVNRIFFVRWVGFISAIWMMQFSGPYTFATYSTALKAALSINQVQLNTLSVGKDLGDALAVVGGVLCNYIPVWSLLTIGATVSFLGFGTLWLVVSGTIAPLPFWLMFIATAMVGNAATWLNTATFTVSMRNFPRNRGPITGLLKANMGLSAAIYSTFCNFLFSSSSSSILLMLTIIPSAATMLSVLLFRPMTPASSKDDLQEETHNVFLFNVLSIVLGVYLVVGDFYLPDNLMLRKVLVGILLVLIVGPAFVLLKAISFKFRKHGTERRANHTTFSSVICTNGSTEVAGSEEVLSSDGIHKPDALESILQEPLLQAAGRESGSPSNSRGEEADDERFSLPSEQLGKTTSSKRLKRFRCFGNLPVLGEDRSTLQVLRSWDFYVFYIASLCAAGSGMAFSNNLGQVGQSLGFSSVTIFTSCFSLGNFCGRIISGVLSEYMLRKAAIPRSTWMALAKIPMVGMFFWLATGSALSLYVGSVVLGVCHGFHITLMIPVVCEFYGLKSFGTNFTISMTVLLAGSFLFSEVLAGNVYDWEAAKQQGLQSNKHGGYGRVPLLSSSDSSLTCYGAVCYKLTFNVIAVLLIFATVLDLVLVFISRSLYKNLQIINQTSDT